MKWDDFDFRYSSDDVLSVLMHEYFSMMLLMVEHDFLYSFNCLLVGLDDIVVVIEMFAVQENEDIISGISNIKQYSGMQSYR